MSLREAAEKAREALLYAWHEDEAHPESRAIIEALRAALAEAESAEAEPVAWTTDYEIEGLRDGFVQQLTGRSVRLEPSFPAHQVKYLYTHPPAREAESAGAELSDEEILEIWSPSLDGNVQRPILGKNKIIAFARAVLAARGKG